MSSSKEDSAKGTAAPRRASFAAAAATPSTYLAISAAFAAASAAATRARSRAARSSAESAAASARATLSDSGTNITVSETYATNAVAAAITALYSELNTNHPSNARTESITDCRVSAPAFLAARSAAMFEANDQSSGTIPAKSAATAR